jgi:hypothetical protein
VGAKRTNRGEKTGAVRLGLVSLARFARMARRGELRLYRQRVGSSYRLFDERLYRVFRDTTKPQDDHRPAVIEVAFRLKLIGSKRAPHWLFQRLCILTTPFWSGFDGFAEKLWMVEPERRGYAGIYEWAGVEAAQHYLDVLLPVLRAVSVSGSVAYQLHPDTELEDFLRERCQQRDRAAADADGATAEPATVRH